MSVSAVPVYCFTGLYIYEIVKRTHNVRGAVQVEHVTLHAAEALVEFNINCCQLLLSLFIRWKVSFYGAVLQSCPIQVSG